MPMLMQDDVALAVDGDKIAAIGPTDAILRDIPAPIYDGRGKAMLPGLINCHAHVASGPRARLQRGLRIPKPLQLAVQPGQPPSAGKRPR